MEHITEGLKGLPKPSAEARMRGVMETQNSSIVIKISLFSLNKLLDKRILSKG